VGVDSEGISQRAEVDNELLILEAHSGSKPVLRHLGVEHQAHVSKGQAVDDGRLVGAKEVGLVFQQVLQRLKEVVGQGVQLESSSVLWLLQ